MNRPGAKRTTRRPPRSRACSIRLPSTRRRAHPPLIRPSKVYLDTSHWIGLSQGRHAAPAFERLVANGAIAPVLSFAHISDLAANADRSGRSRAGMYLDRVCTLGAVLWVQGLNTCAADELQAFYETVKLKRPLAQRRSPFSTMLVDSLDFKNHSNPIDLEAARRFERKHSVAEIIDAVAQSPGRPEYAEFRAQLPASITRIRESRGALKRFTSSEIRQFVRDIIAKASLVFRSGAEQELFVDAVLARQDEHPALNLRLRYRQGGILTDSPAAPSDVEDYDHLAGFAYCDVAFADKRTIDALRRAGCDRLPLPNGCFDRWLKER